MTSTPTAPAKIVAAWAGSTDPVGWHAATLRRDLAAAGAYRWQLNTDDEEIPESALRLHRSAAPVQVVTSV